MTDVQEAFYKLVPEMADVEPDDEGVIEYADRRFVFFHSKVFAKLFDDMEKAAGEEIRGRIKEFGEEAGHSIAEKMDEDFKDVGLVEIIKLLFASGFDIKSIRAVSPTDDLSQLEKIFGYGRYVGWLGPAEIVEYEENERAEFSFSNSFESFSYSECKDEEEECKAGETSCSFLEGVIQGLVGFYWDRDVESREVACASNPDVDECVMVIE